MTDQKGSCEGSEKVIGVGGEVGYWDAPNLKCEYLDKWIDKNLEVEEDNARLEEPPEVEDAVECRGCHMGLAPSKGRRKKKLVVLVMHPTKF